MTIPKPNTVRMEHQEGDVGGQVLPDVKEARLHQNPTKLQQQRVMKLGEEDPLVEVIKPGYEICPPPKRFEILMLASTLSTLWEGRFHGSSRFIQEPDVALGLFG
ncbi:hypothetical protein Acr_00g0031430 [Actinidia rufa]|uniref:Uncharacterized protein n=1 Tax=Actinidia rufa TaxID=165716 RepID=A0A7J0DGZ9_9ERIC|nr:hypothetical protein Acr_00g0031430 [Actinidia rufa]